MSDYAREQERARAEFAREAAERGRPEAGYSAGGRAALNALGLLKNPTFPLEAKEVKERLNSREVEPLSWGDEVAACVKWLVGLGSVYVVVTRATGLVDRSPGKVAPSAPDEDRPLRVLPHQVASITSRAVKHA